MSRSALALYSILYCVDSIIVFLYFFCISPNPSKDLLISLQRGIYCPGEEIKVNLQYKYVEARRMGLVKCRLNKYKQLNKRENKSVYKKTVKEQNGMYMLFAS